MANLCKKGATKHCCHGICNSDSRYAHKEYMQGVEFIRFPKPWRDIEKCKRWVNACKREGFSTAKVTKDTYICSKHFVGGKGPTIEHPDPLPATATESEIKKCTTKRKCPTPRQEISHPRNMARKSLYQELEVNTSTTESIPQCTSICQTSDKMTDKCLQVKPQEASMSTQTERNINIELEVRIENSMLKNKVKLLQNEVDHLQTSSSLKLPNKQKSSVETSSEFTFDVIMKDKEKFKYYTGLTISQFMCLWEYLGPSKNKLVYWNSDCEYPDRSPTKRPGPKRKLEPKNELFMTLMRLRHGFLVEDLSYRFNVSTSMVSRIILTWVQFLYKRFLPLRSKMFPSRSHLRKFAPKSFKKYKNIRCIIDCTEVFVQQPRDFGKQGNCYSSYKGHTTYKFLVAIAPNGAIVFVSDAFEGSISDKDIVIKSGFLDHLENGDVIMADRGFVIDDLLMTRGAKLVLPPFLGGRTKLSAQEEASTKDIAKHRIHVERTIERMKKFRILQKTIPLSLEPVFSQLIFVVGCLVNFQDPIVK